MFITFPFSSEFLLGLGDALVPKEGGNPPGKCSCQ